MNYDQIISELKSLKNPKNVEGMARFGINPKNTLGISIYNLRPLAKQIGKNHQLALQLWKSKIHEARILASYIDEPEKVTDAQLESWVSDFDSWDIVDQVSELIAKTPYVIKKIHEWSNREDPARNATQSVAGGEFVKRAGFALIAEIAWHDKKMADREFEQFFPLIKRAATDERNFVKKAVNWALRNIGKRDKTLNKRAIDVAKELAESEDKTAKWIAKDALRELTSEKIQSRVK